MGARRTVGRLRMAQRHLGLVSGSRAAVAGWVRPGAELSMEHGMIRAGTNDLDVYIQVMCMNEYAFEYPHEPRTIIDAGAHIGLASRWFASQFPDATIIALELEPTNVQILRKTV